ncbi:MAG TPA: adenylate/guanylate cyclase domain-containing protein [Gaiellaceae bacterium]|nr:adenylate/guanylate cyclase domain-containing protein [Gaiellaceae bacterium]
MSDPQTTEEWRRVLMGEVRGLRTFQWIHKKIPSEPRCKLCYAPFGKPGGLFKFLGWKPSPLNRRLCTMCTKSAHKHPGGAEVEISAMFADVRGSTGLAERLPPGEFGQLITRFWGTAARVVDRWDGIVDKFVGDEAVALFIPGFAGKDHASRAVETARELLLETGHGDGEPWIPVGVGIHTGLSYVGYIGEGDALDFTAVGDTVNTAARLTSIAKAGEIVMSDATARAGGLDTSGLEQRTLELRGREQSVDAWVQPAISSVATTAA